MPCLQRGVLGVLLCLSLTGALGADHQRITIGTVGSNFAPSVIARTILTEAYAAIGYQAVFIEYPPLRMLAELRLGRLDALILAEADFASGQVAVLRVPTPIWVDEIVAFTAPEHRPRTWDEVRRLRVGYIPGMLIVEKRLATAPLREPASDPDRLFEMLNAHRTEAVVTSKILGETILARSRFAPIVAGPTLEVVPNYHFLRQGHEVLAGRLDAVLVEMQAQGRLRALAEGVRARLLSEASGPVP